MTIKARAKLKTSPVSYQKKLWNCCTDFLSHQKLRRNGYFLWRWMVTRKPLGPPPKTMVSGLLPPLYKKGGTGTVSLMCWWKTLHVKIWFYNRLEADLDYLKTYSDKLKLVRLYIKKKFLDFLKIFLCLLSYQVVSCFIYLYLVIMSSTYLRSH